MGQTEKAIQLFEQNLKDAEENFLKQIVVLISRQLIVIYHKIAENFENDENENIQEALFYYEKCLNVAQKAEDQEAEGSICYKIGLLYFKSNDYEKTIEYQNKYLEIASNNPVGIFNFSFICLLSKNYNLSNNLCKNFKFI